MGKKCVVCGVDAEYRIKDTSDYYCGECAQENFSDLHLLVRVEREAQLLREVVEETLDEKKREERDDNAL